VLAELFSPEGIAALLSVILIDIALAGDNAVVVGMAAAGLPAEQRRRAILVGIAAAAGLRIVFASFTVQLLEIIGLLLAGGLLLLWVAWKLWREIRSGMLGQAPEAEDPQEEATPDRFEQDPSAPATVPQKSFRQAVAQIIIADVSMSLDNVLAVAGAAREHEIVLIFGLALSVALMGVAASLVAHLLRRCHWIAYLGLAIILYVALRMIWDGANELLEAVQP
jgi:YjbE family integral membrane protein